MDRRTMNRVVRSKLREVGRRYEEARRDYEDARDSVFEDDPANLVCRRYAERRSVEIDATGRPACYEPGHPDCEGCVEDVRSGTVETW